MTGVENSVPVDPAPPYNSARELHLRAFEVRHEAARLTEADAPWLTDLAGPNSVVDAEWLETANAHVVVGSIHLRDTQGQISRQEILAAREKFLGKMLGWNDPEHEMHKSYNQHLGVNPHNIPLDTFIGTQRLLHERGIKNSAVIRGAGGVVLRFGKKAASAHLDGLKALGYDPLIIQRNSRLFSNSLGTIAAATEELRQAGKDPHLEAARDPSILVSSAKRKLLYANGHTWSAATRSVRSTRVRKKQEVARVSADTTRSPMVIAERIAHMLGWQGDVAKVAGKSRTFEATPITKLRLHAKLFARYGAATMTDSEVAALIDLPPKAHLGAIILGKAYAVEDVEEVRDMLASGNPYKEVKHVKDTLADTSALEQIVGAGVVRAYNHFLIPRKQS